MSKTGMLAAVSAAAAGVAASAGEITVDAASVKKYFPDVAAALIAEGKAEAKSGAQADTDAAHKAGAAAERERIIAIEQAALPGHEALVAAHKADGSKSAGDLALAIVAAEKATRAGQLAALDADEKGVKVPTQPANPAAAAPGKAALEGKEGVDKYKAEWSADPKLADEFTNFEAYAALRSMEEQGRVKVYKSRAA